MEIAALTAEHRSRAVELWDLSGLTRPWNPPGDDFDRAVKGQTSCVLGGFVGSFLVGTIMAGYDGHRGWLYYLAVDPEHRGHGFGSDLMVAGEHWLAGVGAPKVQLLIRSDNAGIVKLYQSMGYEQSSTIVLGKALGADA